MWRQHACRENEEGKQKERGRREGERDRIVHTHRWHFRLIIIISSASFQHKSLFIAYLLLVLYKPLGVFQLCLGVRQLMLQKFYRATVLLNVRQLSSPFTVTNRSSPTSIKLKQTYFPTFWKCCAKHYKVVNKMSDTTSKLIKMFSVVFAQLQSTLTSMSVLVILWWKWKLATLHPAPTEYAQTDRQREKQNVLHGGAAAGSWTYDCFFEPCTNILTYLLTLATSSTKCSVMVWRTSVPLAYLPWLTRGQHATWPVYISAQQ